ncbi:unnamed protein product [Paramecium octaurelia]|uniref:Uncharacterized protein n=1 Tax=Paramecium octaurelia TaxID=43137 RepID=A0A8S1UUB4_PAROT|nr:unnamed protein product [Paramecium octaurelia]
MSKILKVRHSMMGIMNIKDCHEIARQIIKIVSRFIEIMAIVLNFNKFGEVTNAIPKTMTQILYANWLWQWIEKVIKIMTNLNILKNLYIQISPIISVYDKNRMAIMVISRILHRSTISTCWDWINRGKAMQNW